mgnify:CR=1 FL=1
MALNGDLGMGKSEIARTIIQTLRGPDTVVPSPTFTIVQNYDGISHFDLYRIEDASELTEVGLAHAIANDIFRQDLISVYKSQTATRDNIKDSFRKRMNQLLSVLYNGNYDYYKEKVI